MLGIDSESDTQLRESCLTKRCVSECLCVSPNLLFPNNCRREKRGRSIFSSESECDLNLSQPHGNQRCESMMCAYTVTRLLYFQLFIMYHVY